MKVNLARTFPRPGPADEAWALLQQVQRIAACMPGARLTERVDARRYKGTVAVRFGPASLSFRGELEIVALEPATRTLHLVGRGTDTTGGSGASLDLTARVDAVDAASCTLAGNSEVSLSGKAAAFGGRMAESVAQQVLQQFADNFAAQLCAQAAAAAPAGITADAAAAATPPSAPRATHLNVLALLWGVLRYRLRALLGLRGA